MGRTFGIYSVRNLSHVIFYLNLCDILSDFAYYLTQDFSHPGLRRVCLMSLLANNVGILVLLMLGFLLNCAFPSEPAELRTSLREDLKEMMQVWQALCLKRVLELPQAKYKAIHRASLLIHVVLEALPQLIIQGMNNYQEEMWLEPLAMASYSASATMVLAALVTMYQTDKYGGY